MRRVASRIAMFVGTLIFASFIVYGAAYLTPGSALGTLTGGRSLPPETLKTLEEQYGLNQSFLGGYGHWLAGVLHGDLGQSVIYGTDVSQLLRQRAGVTASLCTGPGSLDTNPDLTS